MSQRFKEKVAIVTGAGCVGPGWGNGRAIAVRLAEEGAMVFACDRDLSRVEETVERAGAVGAAIVPHACDVTSSADLAATVEACLARFGKIDVLVNNVGGSAAGGPVELAEDAWNTQVDINLKSVFLACKHVLPHMVARKAGAVVNLASTSGLRWTGSAQVAYAATKAGVIQMSRVIAVQHAPDGIRVNTVVPGQLHTPMVEARLAGQRTGATSMHCWPRASAAFHLASWVMAATRLAAVAYLASDEARFVTGTEIVVDGGMIARCD
ncbi:SDR family NAD(P)-dependent oxidoreductase [Bradyrhizobium sp. BR 1432]|uniref:SDR family NAD(P)-dependent oxidoreductase n=1 Tax=Bradyrhizobium sp. BR 1432 TaxID=3447966 RepID=UPI003EE59549